MVDAMTGQDAVNVAKTFDTELGIDGVILTKLDGDTRGGAALSIRAVVASPSSSPARARSSPTFEPFHPDRMASRILGMGDVMTASSKRRRRPIDGDEAEESWVKRGSRATSSPLEDFLSQMQQMKKMGGLAKHAEHAAGCGQQAGQRRNRRERHEKARSHHPQHDPAASAGIPASSTPAAASASRRAAAPPCRTSTPSFASLSSQGHDEADDERPRQTAAACACRSEPA